MRIVKYILHPSNYEREKMIKAKKENVLCKWIKGSG